MKLKPLVLSLLLAASSTGCSLFTEPRDAQWDPKHPAQLMDQIPNWEGAAGQICGGHLTEAERQRTGKSPRC